MILLMSYFYNKINWRLLFTLILHGLIFNSNTFPLTDNNKLHTNFLPYVSIQEGHFKDILTISPSQDGSCFATGSLDNSLIVWDMASGHEISVLKGHQQGIVSAAIIKNDVISGAYDGAIRLWNKDGSEKFRLDIDTNSIHSVAVTPDGKYALSGYLNGYLKLWDLNEKKLISEKKPHTDRVHWTCFSPDGKLALTCSRDETFIVWDTWNYTALKQSKGRIRCASFSSDGKYILSGYADNIIRLLDYEKELINKTFKGHKDIIIALSFNQDGEKIMSASIDGDIKIWDIQSEKELTSFSDKSGKVTAAKFLPEKDMVFLAYGKSDPKINVWDLKTKKLIRTFQREIKPCSNISISPDGKLAISGGLKDGFLNLWDIEKGKMIESVSAHKNGTLAVNFTPDGKKAVSGGNDNIVKLWGINPFKLDREFKEGRSPVLAIGFNKDGKQMAAGYADGSINLWDNNLGNQAIKIADNEKMISKISFHPAKQAFYSSCLDGTIKLWDTSGKKIKDLIKLPTPIINMEITNKGENLIYSSTDPIIRTIQPNNGNFNMISGHMKTVTAFTIDSKEELLVSSDLVGTVRSWDFKNAKVIRILQKFGKIMTSIAFYPGDKKGITVNSDGINTIWDFDKGKEIARFASFNDGEWIFLTPEGFFSASNKGAKYLNLKYNNQYLTLKDFEKFLNKPDLVEARLTEQKNQETELGNKYRNEMSKILERINQ